MLEAKDPEQQGTVDRIVRRPAGGAVLPSVEDMTFELWTQIPSGMLPLEAKVAEDVVGPLARILNVSTKGGSGLGDFVFVPEYRVRTGSVDFVVLEADEPMTAIELKLAVRRSATGIWSDSPDFR
jgi:hypothetical protein